MYVHIGLYACVNGAHVYGAMCISMWCMSMVHHIPYKYMVMWCICMRVCYMCMTVMHAHENVVHVHDCGTCDENVVHVHGCGA